MSMIKTQEQIQAITESAQILSEVLNFVESKVGPGVTAKYLDTIAEEKIRKLGGKPAFKGFHGFPATICASRNDQVVHAIPDKTPLKEGDIITVDCGVLYKGMYSDSAFTKGVGTLKPEHQEFIDFNKETLYQAIKMVKPGITTGDIGYFIEERTIQKGYYIYEDLIGHGIGETLHEKPEVPNFGDPGKGTKLKPGMTFCIEPIVGLSTGQYSEAKDGWTLNSIDGSYACQHEHTILVTETGHKILTLRKSEDIKNSLQ